MFHSSNRRFARTLLHGALVAAGLSLPIFVRAQVVESDYRPATDTELRAAYCSRIIDFQVEAFDAAINESYSEGLYKAPEGSPVTKMYAQEQEDLRNLVSLSHRYHTFVKSTLYQLDVKQILSAQNQADIDRQRAMAINASAHCWTYSDGPKAAECSKTEESQPEMMELREKEKPCLNPTWLPY